MSYCEEKGKDRVIFLTKEDASPEGASVVLPDLDSETKSIQSGLVREDGSLNWNCPCLGGMAVGPCGVEFRTAFECFHFSEADPKGSDCMDKFMVMQDCMRQYPDLYPESEKDGQAEADLMAMDEKEEGDGASASESATAAPPAPPQSDSETKS